ncbi:hypothetical protein G5714_002759 [Onychostoma macrolepis]|uniref:Uncharacterized protein n=1 Tax=Onychostoma macrolepis TaxID=369639 RepID=A0A7J6D7P2_9TELE|nr:hypothetical protein G5714_002759 [Onychostoma macrolepis]
MMKEFSGFARSTLTTLALSEAEVASLKAVFGRLICRGYLSLHGHITQMRGVRMTQAHVPILDLHLNCGEKVLDMSLEAG